MREHLARHLPMRWIRLWGRIRCAPADLWDTVRRNRDSLTPPRGKALAYGGHFQAVGQEFLRHLVELAGLKQDDSILDIGCGIGRIAVPLTEYLSSQGAYRGFDIHADGVRWCSKNITPRFPQFHFQVADVHNRSYHPRGKTLAAEYRFPYTKASFDVAAAISVFTHMLPPGVENYIHETARVLKPGGRFLSTFFVLNIESSTRISEGSTNHRFEYPEKGYAIRSRWEPEKAVAYDETTIHRIYRKEGFKIIEPIHYGSWSGRTDSRSGQDIVLAVKE